MGVGVCIDFLILLCLVEREFFGSQFLDVISRDETLFASCPSLPPARRVYLFPRTKCVIIKNTKTIRKCHLLKVIDRSIPSLRISITSPILKLSSSAS